MADELQNIFNFYQHVFPAIFVPKVKTETEVDDGVIENCEEKTSKLCVREDYLQVINYPSQNYQGPRRSSYPVFASVSTYF